MTRLKIQTPLCADCSHLICHPGSIQKKFRGTLLQPGCRYCAGGKKLRRFAAKDPKCHAPRWCPLRKDPPVLRIYCYKDSGTALLRFMMETRGIQTSPSAHSYALRFEGPSPATAREFARRLENQPDYQILNQKLQAGEVIEIDDGILPNCFWKKDLFSLVPIRFDGKRARENRLENPCGTEQQEARQTQNTVATKEQNPG